MQKGFAQAASIERLDANGTETCYALPAGVTGANGITRGPDGALWIGASGAAGQGQQGVILRLTTRGSLTAYALTSAQSDAYRITAGPDGALWFTEEYGNRIGRITTSGAVTEYALRQFRQGRSAVSAAHSASRRARTATSGSPRSAAGMSGASRPRWSEFYWPRLSTDWSGKMSRPSVRRRWRECAALRRQVIFTRWPRCG
jgi:streptogramin lyase